jgi:DNA-binding winged helix-turn-helix (wHTH) protein
MTIHPVYDLLIAEITDDLERKVLEAFLEKPGERISRPDLVFAVFGVYVQQKELSSSVHDRKIRECIETLQRKSYPIVSSSGEPGYILAADDDVADAYIAEIGSRIEAMKEKKDALQNSKKFTPFIRQWREARQAVQPRLL